MNRQQGQRESGFTLLEVLVAVAIFAIGLLAVASMQTNAITGNSFAERHTVATAVAQGALENIMARPDWDPIFLITTLNAPYDLDPQTAATTLTVNGGTYSATLNITPNTPVANVTAVAITISGPGTPIVGGVQGLTFTSYKRVSS